MACVTEKTILWSSPLIKVAMCWYWRAICISSGNLPAPYIWPVLMTTHFHNCTIHITMIRYNLLPTYSTSLHISDWDVDQPYFYSFPKIHKINNPRRQMVSACSYPTKHILEFLHRFFQLLVSSLPSFIKDTTHALVTFDSLQLTHGKTYRLFILNVCSLRTPIPNVDGIRALQFFWDQRSVLSPPCPPQFG